MAVLDAHNLIASRSKNKKREGDFYSCNTRLAPIGSQSDLMYVAPNRSQTCVAKIIPSLFLFFVAMCTVCTSATAQDKAYARKVIDTLASPGMHGRGYVNNGHIIASDYIANEFKSFGLFSFEKSGSYFQEFAFPVNTFPGKVDATFEFADGRKEKCLPGDKFLVRSYSPSVKGCFNIVRLDSSVVYSESKWNEFMAKSHKKEFVLVDTAHVRDKAELTKLTNFVKYPPAVKGILLPVVLTHIEGSDHCSKLTPWDFSTTQSTIPVLEIDPTLASATKITVNIVAKLLPNCESRNVVGYVRGSEQPDSFIVFTAHYDHLGRMGKDVYFPGANDNASGVAMMLNLAKYYSSPGNKPKYSIAFIAFGAEEVGLIGSAYFVLHPMIPLARIHFLVNMDILGTGDEGITVVNSTLHNPEFVKMKEINDTNHYLPLIKPRGKASISDHHFFTERGVPCFYIYTLGGIKAYHDTCDKPGTLPLTEYDDLFLLLTKFTDWLQE
jgi:aminopeptidase YwaD